MPLFFIIVILVYHYVEDACFTQRMCFLRCFRLSGRCL